jgi:hypothetical protein
MAKDKTEQVVNILLKAGFVRMVPISTPSGSISRIAGNRFVATSVNIRHKFKYPCGNMRVTVGPRTISFYKVHQKKACDFINYGTAEVDKIKFTIREIQCRCL